MTPYNTPTPYDDTPTPYALDGASHRPPPRKTDKPNTEKWSELNMMTGYTVLPNVIIAYQAELGLGPVDMNILLHLCMFWWKAERLPYPSKTRIARAIGRSPSTVRRHIKGLEDRGLIRREPRYGGHSGNLTNKYDLEGLVQAAMPYAIEMLTEQGQDMS